MCSFSISMRDLLSSYWLYVLPLLRLTPLDSFLLKGWAKWPRWPVEAHRWPFWTVSTGALFHFGLWPLPLFLPLPSLAGWFASKSGRATRITLGGRVPAECSLLTGILTNLRMWKQYGGSSNYTIGRLGITILLKMIESFQICEYWGECLSKWTLAVK